MSLTDTLASRAARPLDARDADHLRALTLTNVLAGAGALGYSGELIERLDCGGSGHVGNHAFGNAMVLHARTQDDFYPHGRVHVGAITLAVALALREETGDRLLECLDAGYEVMCAAADAYSDIAQARGLRPSGVFGPLGAAATAARALDLGPEDTANAIGLAAALAGGTNQAWLSGTDEWMLVVGAAARTGLEAARLTEGGVCASPEALEGPAGWAAALFGDPGAERLAAALADERARTPEVAAKPYPVSGIAQVPTHLAAQAHDSVEPEAIERIVVRLAPMETRYPGTLNAGPFRGRSDALMSVPFTVACALTHGRVELGHLEAPGDAGVAGLLERVAIEPDPRLDENGAHLTLHLRAGARTELIGGGEVLLPSWPSLSADLQAVARRSEAPEGVAYAACEELGRPAPDAGRLAALLEPALGVRGTL